MDADAAMVVTSPERAVTEATPHADADTEATAMEESAGPPAEVEGKEKEEGNEEHAAVEGQEASANAAGDDGQLESSQQPGVEASQPSSSQDPTSRPPFGAISSRPAPRPWEALPEAWPAVRCRVEAVTYRFPSSEVDMMVCPSIVCVATLRLTGVPVEVASKDDGEEAPHADGFLRTFEEVRARRYGHSVGGSLEFCVVRSCSGRFSSMTLIFFTASNAEPHICTSHCLGVQVGEGLSEITLEVEIRDDSQPFGFLVLEPCFTAAMQVTWAPGMHVKAPYLETKRKVSPVRSGSNGFSHHSV